MSPFTPTRALLNPQFEGYKLSFTPSLHLRHICLPHPATQSRPGIRALGFQDVASRVRHNHLAMGEHGAVYVAEDGSVVLVRANATNGDEQEDDVSLRVLFQLPELVSTSAQAQAEYPAAAYLLHDRWLVSDGHGTAYLIRAPEHASTTQMLGSWELLVDDTAVPTSFRLHCATLISPHMAMAILSSSTIAKDAPSSPKAKEQPTFDVWAVRIPLPDPSFVPLDSVSPSHFEVFWRRQGTHVPLFVTYVPARSAFLLLGGSPYRDIVSPSIQPYEPAPDELAPIPTIGENSDIVALVHIPPYSWTQADDTVTLAFTLPGTTPKASIHATFERGTLSLRVGTPSLPQPLYTAAPLWDAIHPMSSIWTWERGNAIKAGLLTIHLDKAHPGTRWSHVFAQGFEAHEVTETLDPSELATIRETLDKFTGSLQDATSGLGHGIPSLAEGERDNEVDASVGNQVVLTWVTDKGNSNNPMEDGPVVLLSLPLPGVNEPLSLVIKNDIDGPIYTLNDTGWIHTATYPALGFVLASKRDTRFTFHVSSSVALAFESGARDDGGGNVYIYRGGVPGDKWAKQGVFQQQSGAGALLGVGALTSKAGNRILLCLSERQLTVCRGLF